MKITKNFSHQPPECLLEAVEQIVSIVEVIVPSARRLVHKIRPEHRPAGPIDSVGSSNQASYLGNDIGAEGGVLNQLSCLSQVTPDREEYGPTIRGLSTLQLSSFFAGLC